MLSKFLRLTYRTHRIQLIKNVSPQILHVRHGGEYIPPTQYDAPYPKRMNLGYALRNYWEISPLVGVTVFALSLMFISIVWAIQHKVDVLFSTHHRNCISRTMNLRHPTSHKLILFEQEYPPWPEMQDVLDKMARAEKRALVRAQACSHP